MHERPVHHHRRGDLPAPHRPAASLYGVGIVTDKEDSPHLLLDQIKGELYYAFAETDRSVPPHIPASSKRCCEEHNVKHEIKMFPGTEHGFAFPERAIYNTLAAEETWDKMFAMWDRTLKGRRRSRRPFSPLGARADPSRPGGEDRAGGDRNSDLPRLGDDMKLRHTPPRPMSARSWCAHELGLAGRIELLSTAVSPVETNATLPPKTR